MQVGPNYCCDEVEKRGISVTMAESGGFERVSAVSRSSYQAFATGQMWKECCGVGM
jgi:hypothetical protein